MHKRAFFTQPETGCHRKALICQPKALHTSANTYQSQRLDKERPGPQETSDDEATQNRFDLGDTAVFRIGRELSHKQTCTGREQNLGILNSRRANLG